MKISHKVKQASHETMCPVIPLPWDAQVNSQRQSSHQGLPRVEGWKYTRRDGSGLQYITGVTSLL